MSNSFSKEERVAFEDILEGFNDALVLSRNVSVYNTDGSMMERTNDVIWRPQPYIATSINGAPRTDISSQFVDFTQLAVPATLGFSKTVPFALDAKELRGLLDAAKQRLGSGVAVIVAVNDGKASIAAAVTDDLTAKVSAVDLVRAGVEALGGKGGGGRPDMAQGGGPDGSKAAEAMAAVKAAKSVVGVGRSPSGLRLPAWKRAALIRLPPMSKQRIMLSPR